MHFQKKLNNKLKNKLKKKFKKKGSPGLPKQKPTTTITSITGDIVNTYIKEHPETVTNHLRTERVMKTQRKQMNARSLLNNTFFICFMFVLYIDIKHGE